MIAVEINGVAYALPRNWDDVTVGPYGAFVMAINRILRETPEAERGPAFELRAQLYALGAYMTEGADNPASPMLRVLMLEHVAPLLQACAFLFEPPPDADARAVDVIVEGQKYLPFDNLEGTSTGWFLDLKAVRERMEADEDAPWRLLPELLATMVVEDGNTYEQALQTRPARIVAMRRMKLLDALALRGFFLRRTIGLSDVTLQSIAIQARATRTVMRAIRSASRPSLWRRITAFGRTLWRMPTGSRNTWRRCFRRAPAASSSVPITSQTKTDAPPTRPS